MPLWRMARARSLLVLGFLGVIGGLALLVASVYTDLLWFQEVGQEEVFWTTLKWKVLSTATVGLGTTCFLLLNFAIAERVMAGAGAARLRSPVAAIWPYRRLIYPVVAVACGLLSIEMRPEGWWQLVTLWVNRGDFGVTDPLFERDVGFFVFSLPLYQEVANWLLATLVMSAVASVAAYVVAGGAQLSRPRLASRAARAHLLGLAALLLLLIAFRLRLEQFLLELPEAGAEVSGATYTDVHVALPVLRLLTAVALVGALLCLYAGWRRVPLLPAIALTVLAAVALVGRGGVTSVIERFDVQPQELSRERPYLTDAIESTRRAFALDRVDVRLSSGSGELSAAEIDENRLTVENVPLWDPTVLKPAMNELQSIGRYYGFTSTTVDRYRVDGEPRLMTVGARELDLRDLGPEFRTWANERFAYTHGYGVVAAEAGDVNRDGYPSFAQREFGARNPLELRQPRIYFGERPGSDPAYLIAPSGRGEIEQPISGTEAPDYEYDGDGGIALNPLRQAAFALRFGDPKLLLSETVTDESRIVLHRDVRERVQALAPFLDWDSRPQTVVVDGQLKFLLHGYTTSSTYPYSALVRMGGSRVNYARDAAHAVVDAFTGDVDIYAAAPEDPILHAWQSAYPGLFLPAASMPREIEKHLRYPEPLFDAQAAAYATHHATDATGFWNGADAWKPAHEFAGPAETVGEIQFPDPRKGLSDEDREKLGGGEDWRMRPSYLFARLPGDTRERLMLTTSFSPAGRENLVAYLAGSIDRNGRPQLTAVSLPRDELTPGPTQATREILASPAVNQRIELLNRESRDLGEASVNRTILGVPRLVPIADAFVYVQPIYVASAGSGVPRLQLVTVYTNGRVGYGQDLVTALRRTVSAESPT
jgi:uncharacterized protein